MQWFNQRYGKSRLFRWAANTFFSLLTALTPLAIKQISSRLDHPATYERWLVTQRGEARCEPLLEGSRVCLDGGSEVRLHFNESTRNVEVLRGTVSFVVQKDRRPFDVLAERLLIHDVSTGFLVSMQQPNLTDVAVTEGRIRIVAPVDTNVRSQFARGKVESAWKSAPELQKFDQIEFDQVSGQWHALPQLAPRQLSTLLNFEVGSMDLHDRTLSESFRLMARYRDLPIIKCSAGTGNTRLDGEFLFNDLDGLLSALNLEYGIRRTPPGTGDAKVIILTSPLDKAGEAKSRCY